MPRFAPSPLALSLALLGGIASLPAAAQSMRPGLWEMQTQVQQAPQGSQAPRNAMGQMHEQMERMPPAQRQQMEAMLAQRGMSFSGDGMRMKTCVTPEMAARSDVPDTREGHCQTTASPRVGNTLRFTYRCSSPPSEGAGVVTYTGRESYTMHSETTSTLQGKPHKTVVESSGRWLGADCGNTPAVGARTRP